MDALTFLDRLAKAKPLPFYVLHGDEPFLERRVILGLRTLSLGPDDDGFGVSAHPGDKATWAAVMDDFETLPMLSPRKLVLVEQADPFVSRERARLEKFVADLPSGGEVKGVLALCVQTWAATTKLAKMTPDANTIVCRTPASHGLAQWCVAWCASHHGKQLDAQAARLLVDLIGPEMGLLDSEMEKLSVYVGSAPKVEARDVDQLVGRCREENVWHLFDLIGQGRTAEALTFLTRLYDQGEEPLKLLSTGFSTTLRRVAKAARLNAQGSPLNEAMDKAGTPKFPAARQADEQLMRHLGRRRLDRLYDWLLETDSGMKGGSALPPAVQLERLVVRLARTKS
jgi:DNA polymerase-3 subunit delta